MRRNVMRSHLILTIDPLLPPPLPIFSNDSIPLIYPFSNSFYEERSEVAANHPLHQT